MFRSRFMLAAASALAALSFASPAHADYMVNAMRLDGAWETSAGQLKLKFGAFDGDLVGELFDTKSLTRYRVWWSPTHSLATASELGREIDAFYVVDTGSGSCRLFNPACASGRVTLALSEDGSTVSAIAAGGKTFGGWRVLKGRRVPADPTVTQRMADWAGDWETNRGRVTFRPEGNMLVGSFAQPGATPAGRGTIAMVAGPGNAYGAWDLFLSEPHQRGDIRLTMNADKKGFTGQYLHSRTANPSAPANYLPWTGQRAGSSPAEPQPVPPVVTTPPAPTPPAPAPAETAGFKPLRRVDVRLDRIVEARGTPTRQVHAFVTIRNVSATQQYISSGYLRAILTDADGVAQERNQVWRASGEPAGLFSSTPVVQPGAELKLRYVFNPDEGSRTATFALSEGDKRVEFQAGAL